MYTQSTSNTVQILTIYCALQHCVYSFNVFSCSIYICTGDPFSWFFDHIIHNHFNNSSIFISVLLVAFLHVVFIQFLVLHFRSTSLSHSSVQVVYLSVLHRVQLWLQVFATLEVQRSTFSRWTVRREKSAVDTPLDGYLANHYLWRLFSKSNDDAKEE